MRGSLAARANSASRRHLRAGCQHAADKAPAPARSRRSWCWCRNPRPRRTRSASEVAARPRTGCTAGRRPRSPGWSSSTRHVRQVGGVDLERLDPEVLPQGQQVVLAHRRSHAAQHRAARPVLGTWTDGAARPNSPPSCRARSSGSSSRLVRTRQVLASGVSGLVGQAQHRAGVADVDHQQRKAGRLKRRGHAGSLEPLERGVTGAGDGLLRRVTGRRTARRCAGPRGAGAR